MKQIGSVITGSPSLAQRASSSTGMRHGATGSAALPTIASPALLASEPQQTERLLAALLPPPASSWLTWRERKRREPPGADTGQADRAMTAAMTATDQTALERASIAYRRALLPAPDDRVAKEIAAMCALVARRAEDTADTALYIRALVEKLRTYPGDVVLHVLRTQPGIDKWRPTWSELSERLALYANKRRQLADGIDAMLKARKQAA